MSTSTFIPAVSRNLALAYPLLLLLAIACDTKDALEERSPRDLGGDKSADVRAEEPEEQSTDKTEEQSTDKTEEQSTDKTEEQSTDKTEDQTTDKTEEQSTDKTEDQTTDKTEDQTTDKTEDQPEPSELCLGKEDGAKIQRVRYLHASSEYPDLCQNEVQVAVCEGGILSDFTGRYKELSCSNHCTHLSEGDKIITSRFALGLVTDQAECSEQIQTGECTNGTITFPESEYIYDTCRLECNEAAGLSSLAPLRFAKPWAPSIGECAALQKNMKCSDGQLVYTDVGEQGYDHCTTFPKLGLRIPPASMNRLIAKREEALDIGFLIADSDDEVPVEVEFDGKLHPAKARLKGDLLDHLNTDRWSFRIKIRDSEGILGIRKFSVQMPQVRGDNESILLGLARNRGLISPKYEYVSYSLNGNYLGIMVIEEHYSKELLESQRRRESPIFAYDEDYIWKQMALSAQIGQGNTAHADLGVPFGDHHLLPFKIFKRSYTTRNPILNSLFHQGLGLLRGYKEGLLRSEQVFDMAAYAKFVALEHLFGAWHGLRAHNMRLYFNPITRLFEPILFDNTPGAGAAMHPPELIRSMTSKIFLQNYEKETDFYAKSMANGNLSAKIAAEIEYYKSQTLPRDYLRGHFDAARIRAQLAKMQAIDMSQLSGDGYWPHETEKTWPNIENPIYSDFLLLRYIESTSTATYISPIDKSAYLEFRNGIPQEIKISGIYFKDGSTGEVSQVSSDSWALPPYSHSVGNTKIAVTPYRHRKDRYFVKATYRDNTDAVKVNATVSSAPAEAHPTEPLSSQDFLLAHPQFNLEGEELVLPSGIYEFGGRMVFPRGTKLRIQSNTTLRMKANAKWILWGPLLAEGTASEPISFVAHSPDGWRGLHVLQAHSRSKVTHTNLSGVNVSKADEPGYTGAMTFYDSDVTLHQVKITENDAEDSLNIIASDLEIDGLIVKGSTSDAVDIDFGVGVIRNVDITNSQGDGLDFSGSRLEISQATFKGIKDKAVSVGEKSEVIIEGITVDGSNYGVVSKDLSIVHVSKGSISNTKTAFASYVKKPTYGPAHLYAADVVVTKSENLFLEMHGCTVTIEGASSPDDSPLIESRH